jgi:hypothetical protein
MEEGGAMACSVLLVPSYAVPNLPQTGPAPGLPAGFDGATGSKNWSQVGIEDFLNGPILTCLMDRALFGDREAKVLPQDFKDVADEPFRESIEHNAREARACESGRLQHAAGFAVLRNPPFSSGAAWARAPGNLQWSCQSEKLSSARNRRVFQ